MSYRDGYNQLQESNDEIGSNISPNNAQNNYMNSQRQFYPNKAESDFNENPNGAMTQNLVENEDNNNFENPQNNTNYNNYIQKKRPKTSIKWRNVMKIDLDLIKTTNDLSLLNNYLENFLYSTITEEDIQAVPEGNVAKLIKILQFVNEFLLNSRQNLNESINSLNGQRQELINQHQKLEEKLMSEKECLDKYNKERKIRMKELADYKNAVNALLQGGVPNFDFQRKTNITSIDINKKINYNYSNTGFRGPMNGYKCKYCIGKIFSSEFELKKHLNDIHLISQFPDEEINLKSVTHQQFPQQINVTMPPLNNNQNNNNEKYEKKLNEMRMEFQQFMNKAEMDSLKNQILRQRNNNQGDDCKHQLERMGNTFNDTLKQILGVMVKNQEKQKIIINPVRPQKNLRDDEDIISLKNEIDKVNKMLDNKRREYEEKKLKLKKEISVLTNQKLQINIEMNESRIRQPSKKKILSVEQMDTLSYVKPNVRKYGQQEILESDHDDDENETIDLYKRMQRNSELINIILKKKTKTDIKETIPIEDEEEKLRKINLKQDDGYEDEGEDLEHFYKKYINRDQNFLNIPVFKRYLKRVLPNQFDNNNNVRNIAASNINNKLTNTARCFYKEDTSKIPPTHNINELVKEDKNDLINLIKDISQDMEILNQNDDNIKDPYYVSVMKLIDFDDIENTVNMLDNIYKGENLNRKLRAQKKVLFSDDKLKSKNIGSFKVKLKEDEPGNINYFSGGNALLGKEPGDINYFSGGNALLGKEPGDSPYFSGGNALLGKEPGDINYFSGGNALAGQDKNKDDQKDVLKNKNTNSSQDQTLNNTLSQNPLLNNKPPNSTNANPPDQPYTSTYNGPKPDINTMVNPNTNPQNPSGPKPDNNTVINPNTSSQDVPFTSTYNGPNPNSNRVNPNTDAQDVAFTSTYNGPNPNSNRVNPNTSAQDVAFTSTYNGPNPNSNRVNPNTSAQDVAFTSTYNGPNPNSNRVNPNAEAQDVPFTSTYNGPNPNSNRVNPNTSAQDVPFTSTYNGPNPNNNTSQTLVQSGTN